MVESWPCSKCKSPNQVDDRYCGECGTPRNVTVVTPIQRPAVVASGLLNDVKDGPARTTEGLPLVIMAAAASAAVLGLLYYAVGRFVFNLVIIFPILLGLGIGWSIRLAALKGRCRQVGVIMGLAIVAGLSGYGVSQTLTTMRDRDEMVSFLNARAAEQALPGENVQPVSLNLVQAFRIRAEAGIGIGSVRRAKKSMTLSGTGFWIFLLVEAGLAAGMAGSAIRPMSGLAYCAACRFFIPSVAVFRVNGRDSDKLADAVRRQQWKDAQDMSNRASATPADRAEASLLRCAGCEASSIRVDVYAGKRFKKVMHVALPAESLEALARTA